MLWFASTELDQFLLSQILLYASYCGCLPFTFRADLGGFLPLHNYFLVISLCTLVASHSYKHALEPGAVSLRGVFLSCLCRRRHHLHLQLLEAHSCPRESLMYEECQAWLSVRHSELKGDSSVLRCQIAVGQSCAGLQSNAGPR